MIILGAAHPFRGGGITTFNERLARAFMEEGHDTTIYNFSLQYPGFLFPGKSQYSTEAPPAGLRILSKVNSINPLNWIKTGRELKRLCPELIIVRYWIPLMGPALGTILKIVKRNRYTRIIAITDNVIPHEKRPGDRLFTKYFLASCHGFITMSDKVMKDLRSFEKKKPAVQTLHPLYDSFGEAMPKQAARKELESRTGKKTGNETLLLFFGFIRKYKGLDLLFEAMHLIKEKQPGIQNLKLIVAGEFYEDRKYYDELIQKLDIADLLLLKTDYIPEQDVKIYFGAADVVIQPYRNATQSGVTPLAYHFEKPMIVTNVGALADYVPHRKAGLVTAPDPSSIADAILEYQQLGENYFIPHLRAEKEKYSWQKLVKAITDLAGSINK